MEGKVTGDRGGKDLSCELEKKWGKLPSQFIRKIPEDNFSKSLQENT